MQLQGDTIIAELSHNVFQVQKRWKAQFSHSEYNKQTIIICNILIGNANSLFIFIDTNVLIFFQTRFYSCNLDYLRVNIDSR